ncbi:MAG TPA: DUF4317 domain-containing protein [Candidatus Anaeromassilibacillus stercoravium]|nr:DUF4317 domain-containing protein [Candidatus Anaeromassilibacillus stercoravium]
MTQEEIAELRRRFRPDKSAINHIYGCYVNGNREIISYLDEPLGIMPQEESEKYLSLLKKSLSGTQGKNLIDIVFSTQQVADSEEHSLLMALRDSQLKDGKARKAFYDRVIGTLDMDGGNYLLLMAYDAYDVPYKGKDGEMQADASDTVFSYIVCCICPVKDGKPELGFFAGENEFHSCTANQIVAPPDLGFLFPAFDDRAANLYNALFYSKKPDQLHQEFIDAVFHTEPPLSSAEQRDAFETALSDALEGACSMEIAQAIHERLRDQIVQHKERHDPEPLAVTVGEVGAILQSCNVPEEQVSRFLENCEEQFGKGIVLDPSNLIDSGKFEVETADARISVDPERSYLVETRMIDGRAYLLIPADGVTVNGLPIKATSVPEGSDGSAD